MKDIMIDLETLGKGTEAPVISIGAVYFDSEGLGKEFYVNLELQSQIDTGLRRADASTIQWWMGQSDAAKRVFKESAVPTSKGLLDLVNFILEVKDAYVWGNGATFDISILESLLQDYEIPVPWKYNRIMDFRTYKRFLGQGREIDRSKGVHHNALDDAKVQASYISLIMAGQRVANPMEAEK